MESVEGLGTVTEMEGCREGGAGAPLLVDGPLKDILLCSLIFFGSEGFGSAGCA